eukprot:5230501-Alexandrium_andersonii.AAC.1
MRTLRCSPAKKQCIQMGPAPEVLRDRTKQRREDGVTGPPWPFEARRMGPETSECQAGSTGCSCLLYTSPSPRD